MSSLPPDFFEDSTPNIAQKLLGAELGYSSAYGFISGRIVETEAYTQDNEASHSFKGRNKRNTAMFGPAGTIYAYFTYGFHWCLNIVTKPGEAVLIRALEPLQGRDIMRANRPGVSDTNLTNGPAKLTQALGINGAINNTSIFGGPLSLVLSESGNTFNITSTTRVGISQATDKPWRYYIKDNPYISRGKPSS